MGDRIGERLNDRIPERLKYNNFVPPGLTARVVQMRYQPSTAGPTIQPGDQVRYLINQSGYWDPYKTMINAEIDFSGLDDWVIAQIDGSAHSIFRSLVINCRGKELERIMEYDVLAEMLHDMQVPIHKRYSKEMQGIGYANYSNQTFGKIEGGLGFAHSKTSIYASGYTSATPGYLCDQDLDTPISNMSVNTRQGVTSTAQYPWNTAVNGPMTFSNANTGVARAVWLAEHRHWGPSDPVQPLYGEYNTTGLQDVADATRVIPAAPTGNNSTATEQDTNDYGVQLNPTTGSFRQAAVKYVNTTGTNYIEAGQDCRLAYLSDVQGVDETFGNSTNVGRALFRQDGTNGVDILTDADVLYGATNKQVFNYAFSNASFEPQFTNGKDVYVNPTTNPPTYQLSYTPTSLTAPWILAPLNKQFWKPTVIGGQLVRGSSSLGAFLFPLLSGIFGCYMPTKNYKLLPMKIFPDLSLEFQINPWFIFTSGYTNVATNSRINQPKRAFNIKRLEIVTDQYIIDDQAVDQLIMGSYNNAGAGFRLHTNSFYLGPTYNIIQNQIPATMQLNLGFESLKNLFWCYLAQDFQNYSWCRRSFRLSHNITKEQVNIEPNQYPSQPPLANAGNIAPLPNTGQLSTIMYRHANNELVNQLYKCFGKCNDWNEDCFVNNVNFAVNNRCYAPDNDNTKTGGAVDSMGYGYQQSFCQYGWPLVHENRMVGRCLYGLSLEPFAHDKVVINGVNTFGKRPFEITQEFMSDVAYLFNRNSFCLTFAHYDLMLKVTPDGIEVIGRA